MHYIYFTIFNFQESCHKCGLFIEIFPHFTSKTNLPVPHNSLRLNTSTWLALIDVHLTDCPGESYQAVTPVTIHLIVTCTPIQTQTFVAVIDVVLTDCPGESYQAITPVTIHLIMTCTSIQTQTFVAVIDVVLTDCPGESYQAITPVTIHLIMTCTSHSNTDLRCSHWCCSHRRYQWNRSHIGNTCTYQIWRYRCPCSDMGYPDKMRVL